MSRTRTPSDEADVLLTDMLMRLHNQELALRALQFLASDRRNAHDERLDLKVDDLCGLFAVLEAHAADTLKLGDRLEAAIVQMDRQINAQAA